MTLPADLLAQMPMLACPSTEPRDRALTDPNRIFDIKWDGVRALAYIVDGKVTLRNRNGLDISRRYPDVVAHLAGLFPSGERVYDGEIIVCNPDTKRFDFELALKRDAQSKQSKIEQLSRQYPATYMAFDLLWRNGEDFRRRPCGERLLHLTDAPRGLQISQHSTDGRLMWSMVERFGFEGLVVKMPGSTYVEGRHAAWAKVKNVKRCTAIVTGFEYGEGGRRDQVGALFVSLLDGDTLVPVGKAGTGFKQRDHAPLLAVLTAGHEFIAEIEYLEVSKAGQLRHPSYKGVRTDVQRAQCTLAQIGR